MKNFLMVILLNIFCLGLSSQEINENASKYFNILKSKPSPGFMFDRFYGAWMESSDTKALEEYLKKLSVESRSSEIYLLLAFYYQKEGQASRALNVFDSIENEKLLTADVLFYRAKLESTTLNFNDAIKNIDKAIELPLKDSLKQSLLKLKAQVQYRNADGAGARKTFDQLLAINEKDKSIIEDVMEIQLAEGIYEDAKKYCQKLVSLAADNYEKVNYQLKLGAIHKRLNESELAEKLYLDLISLSGQDSWLLKEVIYQYEAIYKSKDNITDLVKNYQEIIKANPQNVYLRKRYSSILSEKGDKEDSIKAFQAIVELLPGDRSIKEEYAGLLVSNGKNEEAVKILESIATTQSGKVDYEIIFRMVELEFKNKKTKSAYSLIENFLKKSDLSEYELLRVGNLIQNNDEIPKVIEFFEKHSSKSPEFIGLKEGLANLYIENKENEKALTFIKNLNIKDDIDLNIRLANLFIKKKLFNEALAILEFLNSQHKKSYKYIKRIYEINNDLKDLVKAKDLSLTLLNVSDTSNEIRESIQTIRSLLSDQELEAQIKRLEDKKDIEAKEIILLANLKFKAFKPDEAYKLIEDNLSRYSSNEVFLELAENFFSVSKEFERSLKVVDILIKNSSKESAKYLLLKTNLLRRSDKLEEAIQIAKQLAIATKNKSDNVILLAELYQQKGELEQGISVLRKATYENPEDKTLKLKLSDHYLQEQNYNDARRIIWSLLESTEDIAEKISYVDKLITSYEYDLGFDPLIENLKERKLNNNKSTFPYLALIRIYQRIGDIENRSKVMIELTQLKSDDSKLYLELADVMTKDLNYDGAENALRKAIEFDKSDLSRKKLVQFYFNTDKEDQALMELAKLLNNSFKEVDILEIVEKFIESEKYDKAYEFLKINVPLDKTYKYSYMFAISAKEAKKEEAQALLLSLLDFNVEFAPNVQMPQNYYYGEMDEDLIPEFIQEINEYSQSLWAYASYKSITGSNRMRHRGRGYQQNFQYPYNLSYLHNYTIAHLGDLYREGNEEKKKEILDQIKIRNISYPEVKLSLDQKSFNRGKNLYADLAVKYPENKMMKWLGIISDRNFYPKVNEKLLPLLKEIKDEDPKFAYWLASTYGMYLSELNQELMDVLDGIVAKVNLSESNRLSFYFGLIGNSYYNNKAKKIPDEILAKYKDSLLVLLDKNVEKVLNNNNSNLFYIVSPTLYKFKDHERYAKFLNLNLANLIKTQGNSRSFNFSHGHYGYGNRAPLSQELIYPSIIYAHVFNYYSELYSKHSSNEQSMDEEFIKKVLPLIENKLLKLAIQNRLGNEIEEEKLIKELESDKKWESIQIVAAYYSSKKKDKETITTLNKALMLTLPVDKKKEINAQIASFASKVDDSVIKAEGVMAAKRLKNFNLSREELLELSILLESLGESAEAEKLDSKISKMNTAIKSNHHNNYQLMQTTESKFESLIAKDKNDSAFKFLISSLKPIFAGMSNQIQINNYLQIDYYSFEKIIKSIEKKNVKAELIKFLSEQLGANEDDLLTAVILLHGLGESKESISFVKKLTDKKPNDLFYKILQYTFNLKNSSTIDESLKSELLKTPFDAITIINCINNNSELFKANILEYKEVYFHLLEKSDIKEQDLQMFLQGTIQPFFNSRNLSKNIYVNSILQKKSEARSKDKNKEQIDNYFLFFEEMMKKCNQQKFLAYYSSSALFQYYIINNKPISDEMIQTFSNVLIEAHNSERGNIDLLNYSHNTEMFMPLFFSFFLYLLNNDKQEIITKLIEKLNKEEKERLNKFNENLKKLYAEVPITLDDISQIGSSITMFQNYDNFNLLMILVNKANVKNKLIHDMIIKELKEKLANDNDYFNYNLISGYFSNYLKGKTKEQSINFLLDLEKKILPAPFDREIYIKNKDNYEHSSKKSINIFASDYEQFNFELFKNILIAGNTSPFFNYVARQSNNSYKMRELPVKDILESGLFSGTLAEIQVVKYEGRNNFLLVDVVQLLRQKSNKQQALEILSKMEQTDGVKLMSFWVEQDSYKKTYEYLGEKIEDFKALPKSSQVEWSEFLTYHYRDTPKEKKEINEIGLAFRNYAEGQSNSKMEELKKNFLEEKFSDQLGGYQFLEMFTEVYPAILNESDEKIASIIKFTQRKYKFYERNSIPSREDNYQRDEILEKILNIDSSNIKHLKIITNLLSISQNWKPDYYQNFSHAITKYISNRIYSFLDKNNIKKNKKGKFEVTTELSNGFKMELNKSLDEVISVIPETVPVAIMSFGEILGPILGKDNALKELVTEWSAEASLHSIKKDILHEFKGFYQKDKSILENYVVSRIIDPLVKPQIKSIYITKILEIKVGSNENKQKILPQHINIYKAEDLKGSNISEFVFLLVKNYDYEILKLNSEEVYKLFKNWYRQLEKIEMGGSDEEYAFENYSVKEINNPGEFISFVKLLKEGLDEKAFNKVFNHGKLGFKYYFPGYISLIKEGKMELIADTFNGKIDAINISVEAFDKYTLSQDDLKLIDQLVSNINDSEKKLFAKILFYRFGVKNNDTKKELELFNTTFKEIIKTPLKDSSIKNKLMVLMTGTDFIFEKEVQAYFQEEINAFQESSLTTKTFKEINVSFYLYCIKYSKILSEKGFEPFKIEIEKVVKKIQESNDKDSLISVIMQSIADNLFQDKQLKNNSSAYFQAIGYLMGSLGHTTDSAKKSFGYSLCLLFLSNKSQEFDSYTEQFADQHLYHWKNNLSVESAIVFFKNVYLQNEQQPDEILKVMNEFFNSSVNEYFDTLTPEKYKELLSFVKVEEEKNKILESLKKFNAK